MRALVQIITGPFGMEDGAAALQPFGTRQTGKVIEFD